MTRFRNRLLILLALLMVAVVGVRNASATIGIDGNPIDNTYTGEPDTPSVKKTSVSLAPSGDSSSTVTIRQALWYEWAGRIWAAVHLGLGR